jgi:centrosomal CEP192-like protein/galactose oxidase-like protein/Kelch motif protein
MNGKTISTMVILTSAIASLALPAEGNDFAYLCETHKRLRRGLPQAVILALLCASLMAFARTALAQEGMFVPTGSMNTARNGHSATLLNNGKVLVAGGTGNLGTASAELYDPATGTFTTTGSMTTTRQGPSATLLSNGKVLVAGGSGGSDGLFLASAELYDPATGTFTATGAMNNARGGQTATLLNNGEVLVAGGSGNSDDTTYMASAELYDPATGTFTATGSMTTARYGHSATLLNNGKVLLAGGLGEGLDLASAELYDPATGTFTTTGSMTTTRQGQTATLLNNGQVLIAGGLNGTPQGIAMATAELYDPATGIFTATGSMTSARVGQTATLLNNGKVLVAGGDASGVSAELYDPATGTFTATGNMNTARENHTATLLNNGEVLVAGGGGNSGNNTSLASAELYIPVVAFPTSLSFPNPPAGTTSESQTVTLANNGSAALNITSIAIKGTNASDFAETDNCLGSVAAGASCSFNVTFTPAVTGSRSGTLTIANNLTGAPLTVPLSGTGIAATRIALSASSLSFTSQLVGVGGAAQALTFSNAGNAPLVISQLAISGSSDFAETDNCGGSISAGATCTINVSFLPTAAGMRTGTLTVTDNATSPQSPQIIALSGTATDFSLGGASGGSTTATVTAGQTANYNLQLSPMGGLAGSVTLVCRAGSPSPLLATCTVTPATLTVSGTSPVSFQVSVTTTAHSSISPGVLRGPWPRVPQGSISFEAFLLLLLLAAGGVVTVRRSRPARAWIRAAILLTCVATLLTACGGGVSSSGVSSSTGTSVGSYDLTVTGTQGGASRGLTLMLTVQ